MTPPTAHRSHVRPVVPDTPGDDVLLEAARDGDPGAFATLRERYLGTALAVARARTDDVQEAEDIASAALSGIGQIVSEGYGPHAFLGAFVVWMVGREADGGTGPVALPEDRTDPASLVRTFTRLPAEWQAFLWHTQIQGRPVRRAAAALGISPVAAAPLERDIFTGLRRAYRHAGTGIEAGAECARSRGDIPGIVRGTLPVERRREVQQHLDACTSCTAEYLRLQDLGTGLRTWVLPVLAGLPPWGAEAAGLAGLIRETDTTAEQDRDVTASPRPGRVVKSLLGAGALVAAASVAVVGLAFTGDPVQDPDGISAGEVAPAGDDAGSGPAGTGSAGGVVAGTADEERTGPPSPAPDRDRIVAAATPDDGWGPAEAAAGVAPGAPQPASEVGRAGAVPVPRGQELAAAALPGWTGSGTERSAALTAAPGDYPAGSQDTAPHDAGSAEAGRASARTLAPEPAPSPVAPAPSSLPSLRSPLPLVLTGPAPERSPAPPSSLPSSPATTGEVRDREVRDTEDRRADSRRYVPEAQWGGRAEHHRGWGWYEGRGGHHDSHGHGGCEHHDRSTWSCGIR